MKLESFFSNSRKLRCLLLRYDFFFSRSTMSHTSIVFFPGVKSNIAEPSSSVPELVTYAYQTKSTNDSNRVIVRHIVVKYMQESICTRYRSWMSTVTWLLFLAYGTRLLQLIRPAIGQNAHPAQWVTLYLSRLFNREMWQPRAWVRGQCFTDCECKRAQCST